MTNCQSYNSENIHTFALRLDEKGQCAIGTLTTLDNKDAMAYADFCVEEGWLWNVGRPLFIPAVVICSEKKGFHQPKG